MSCFPTCTPGSGQFLSALSAALFRHRATPSNPANTCHSQKHRRCSVLVVQHCCRSKSRSRLLRAGTGHGRGLRSQCDSARQAVLTDRASEKGTGAACWILPDSRSRKTPAAQSWRGRSWGGERTALAKQSCPPAPETRPRHGPRASIIDELHASFDWRGPRMRLGCVTGQRAAPRQAVPPQLRRCGGG